jgi:hypothetical protein
VFKSVGLLVEEAHGRSLAAAGPFATCKGARALLTIDGKRVFAHGQDEFSVCFRPRFVSSELRAKFGERSF